MLVVLPGLMTEEVSGMENPYLTIVQSVRPDLVIHELSHSWFGNQVTCNSWPSFWLNEAFAVFVQRKIAKKVLGDSEFDEEVKQGQIMLQNDLTRLQAGSYAELEPEIKQEENPEKAQS